MPAFETLAVHAGVHPDPETGAVMTPIYQTSTYAQRAPGDHRGYEYSRTDNPTRTPLQRCLAALEGARHGLVFSSGLAAIDAVLNLLSEGDHVVAGDDLYGGTRRIFTQVAARRGLSFSFVPAQDAQRVADAIQPATRLIWVETPTNPMLNLVDLRTIAEIGRSRGILTGVDNTFASPYYQRPIDLGLDIVMHSMTKYINGHSDVVMGCLMLNDDDTYGRLKFLQNAIGAVPAPMDCFLALRGIKTLALRMQRHGENAARVAAWLESHPKVERVLYPGLPSHPQHALAARQMSGSGGMITFFVKGGLDEARRFLSAVEMIALAESLGGVESLIEHPAIMTHASVPPEVRREIGVHDNLIRLSVGIESVDDIVTDLERAFASI
ncbi:MAG TPA: cystathionine gamma-synthase [Fimbriimonadaceae bacterium]|nr:cystathionine gamma-synthase [Fimbriimonadaceae bacterium]